MQMSRELFEKKKKKKKGRKIKKKKKKKALPYSRDQTETIRQN